MRAVVIHSLTVTAVLGGLLLGGTAVAAINSTPTATPHHTEGPCALGEVPLPMLHTCLPMGGGG